MALIPVFLAAAIMQLLLILDVFERACGRRA